MIGRNNRGNSTTSGGRGSNSNNRGTQSRGSQASSRRAQPRDNGRDMNTRGNNNGRGVSGLAASAVAATVVNRVVNNVMDNNNSRHVTQQGMDQIEVANRPSKTRALKEIRDRTGASLSEANNAYERNHFDIEAAIRDLSGTFSHQVSTIECSSCRTQNASDVRFCSNCGSGMEASSHEQQPPIETAQPVSGPLTCSGCKANLTGVTENVCPYCRSAFR